MDTQTFPNINQDEVLREVKQRYLLPQQYQIKLLKYSENLTYLLFAEDMEKSYVLRVFRPGYHVLEEMNGELIWINQIIQDTDVLTAKTYLDVEQSFVSEIHLTSGSLYCALFEFIEGQSIRGLNKEQTVFYLKKIGQMMAKLHFQVMAWEESANLKRFSWDIDDLIGPKARWGHFSLLTELPREYMLVFSKAEEVIRRRIERFGKEKTHYGLIHDDISINNILVQGELLYLLDFDDCGFGYFLYDLPCAVLEDFGEELEWKWSALLEGYEQIRPMTLEEKEELPTFLLLKKIVRLGWIATRKGNDTIKKVDPQYYADTYQMAVKYLEKFGGEAF